MEDDWGLGWAETHPVQWVTLHLGSLVPRPLPSFPSLAVRLNVLQTTGSWAGLGTKLTSRPIFCEMWFVYCLCMGAYGYGELTLIDSSPMSTCSKKVCATESNASLQNVKMSDYVRNITTSSMKNTTLLCLKCCELLQGWDSYSRKSLIWTCWD